MWGRIEPARTAVARDIDVGSVGQALAAVQQAVGAIVDLVEVPALDTGVTGIGRVVLVGRDADRAAILEMHVDGAEREA
jgi:hypothetical protein